MAVLLPIVPQGADFSFVTQLDGVAFTFGFRWNWRDSGWYLTLGDAEGTPLAQGLRVVLRTSLLGKAPFRQGFPQGYLYATDTSGQDVEAAQDDIGSRVKVYYLNAADFA
jgi:hypothetical protein